jgi:hypothetical protein
MPVTRLITAEEDIAMSISTTVRGLVAKYNTSAPGQQPAVDAKALLISIVANTCLGVNDLIEACPITFTEALSAPAGKCSTPQTPTKSNPRG